MEKTQKGFIAPPLLILLALLVIGGGMYFNKSKKSEVPSATETTTQQSDQVKRQTNIQAPNEVSPTAHQVETSVPAKTPLLSLQNQCDRVAKKYFDTGWNRTTLASQYLEIVNLNYKNHYNQNNNSCYVLVAYTFNTKWDSGIIAFSNINYTIIDAFQKDPTGKDYLTIGNYSQHISYLDKDNSGLDNCNVSGKRCYSLDSFMSLVNPYVGN